MGHIKLTTPHSTHSPARTHRETYTYAHPPHWLATAAAMYYPHIDAILYISQTRALHSTTHTRTHTLAEPRPNDNDGATRRIVGAHISEWKACRTMPHHTDTGCIYKMVAICRFVFAAVSLPHIAMCSYDLVDAVCRPCATRID